LEVSFETDLAICECCSADQNCSNVSNVLFVDHPAQVGFSYANPVPGYVDANTGNIITLPNATCPEYALDMGSCGTYSAPNVSNTANTTEGAAPSMWKTLQGFMGAFPQYSSNGVHFATESYGGHYGPLFNE
jgi:carboxypeptidase C (cathepsin A)